MDFGRSGTNIFLIFVTVAPLTVFAYGFDAAASCGPKASRRGRAQLLTAIPCDLTTQSYCNLPGTAYPWHAVRQFVHENQGLMRRMYGDIKHISVLRTEIENNDIELADIELAASRYSRRGDRKSKYLYADYQNSLNSKGNDVVFMEPHFRPTSTTTSTTTTTTESTPSATSDQFRNKYDIVDVDDEAEINSVYENATEEDQRDTIKIVQAPNLSNATLESSTISSILKITKSDGEDFTTTTTMFDNTDPARTDFPENINDRIDDDIQVEEDSEGVVDIKETLKQNEATANYFGTTKPDKKSTAKPMESQLFQDTVQKEPPIVNMRGVNACPVKEEVVAPFWANNTRGEVLALLNLYPFEQYVHWEKCTHEHKQMYCREGCRCEQQYRLHRLLAYDPHNECRGIFSDWFRFPSCCICKCYDIPGDYRVTSRSPRSPVLKSIERAKNELQRAVYGHATEDWYHHRMNDGLHDEFD
uniref:Putative spaetzle n=1 Tax=Lutzomyia longipalpis TaxID=7200 RepID=A0A1B0CWU2_LUTLO